LSPDLSVMASGRPSTLSPARTAAAVAAPAIERTWRTPDPVGDTWVIPLPFMVTGDQAKGLNGFLGEWFRAYEEYSIGDFVTQNVETSEYEWENGGVGEGEGGGVEVRKGGGVEEPAPDDGTSIPPTIHPSTPPGRAYQIRIMAWLAP